MKYRIATLLFGAALLPITAAQKLSFEVASVKLGNPASGIDMRTFPGGRLSATNVTLKQLVMGAYNIQQYYEVVGGPSWMDADRFDIEAKAPTDLILDNDRVIALGREAPRQMMLMLQTLLAERFDLKFHRETRQNTVYRLVVMKNGPKLRPTVDATQRPHISHLRSGPVTRPALSYALDGKNASTTLLAQDLASTLGHPVFNETGLAGNFDFIIEYAADETLPDSPPSIYTAIQEQLGLKLESGKGPIEVLVIDSASKPSEN
jgi:uncharacterized protein (TIGR03435 family)